MSVLSPKRFSSASTILPVFCQKLQTRTVGPGARDRRAERTQARCRLDHLHRERIQVGPVRLVQAVGEPAGDQPKVGPLQAQHQLRCRGDVGDRVGVRDRFRDRLRALTWALARPRARPRRPRGPGAPRSGSRPLASSARGADDESAVDRRGDVVGVALDLRRAGEHVGGLEGQLVEVVGGQQPRDDRRRAGAEPARRGGSRCRSGRRSRPRGAATRTRARTVRPVGCDVEAARVDLKRAGLLHLQLEVERQCGREHVVAGPQVRR